MPARGRLERISATNDRAGSTPGPGNLIDNVSVRGDIRYIPLNIASVAQVARAEKRGAGIQAAGQFFRGFRAVNAACYRWSNGRSEPQSMR
jgi:hypothetical protein